VADPLDHLLRRERLAEHGHGPGATGWGNDVALHAELLAEHPDGLASILAGAVDPGHAKRRRHGTIRGEAILAALQPWRGTCDRGYRGS
jgi:hypothetical protein